MLHFLVQRFTRTAMSAVLLSVVCSGVASAQVRVSGTPIVATRTPTRPASKLQTPQERMLIPFLKAHATKASQTSQTANSHAQASATSYASTPPFGGYVNAPNFPAVTTTALAPGGYSAASVELAADFNKDGKADVADIQFDGTLNILINNGSAGLNAPVSYLNPNYPSSSVYAAYAADVNGDGYPDVVAYDFSNNTTITWLNLGNGTFNAAVTTALDNTYGTARFAYVADVNGDGKADLIFANFVASSTGTSSTLYLETQLGTGDGNFGTPAQAKVESVNVNASVFLSAQNAIAVADINGDGKMDIAVNYDEVFGQTGLYVVATALGNNDGTFTGFGSNLPISIFQDPSFIHVLDFNSALLTFADVDGDGKPDLVTNVGASILQTALGKGDGTFSVAVTTDISAIDQANAVALLDTNKDGKLDLIVAGPTMGVFLGNGDGTFAPPVAGALYAIDAAYDYSLATGDFNNDGLNDVAFLGSQYDDISLFFNTGKGGLHGAPVLISENDPQATATVLLTAGTYTSNGYSSPLVQHNAGTGSNSGDLVTLLSDGKGNFTNVIALPVFPSNGQYFEPIHADFNGDGLEDIVYADTAGSVWIALSKGDGTFTTPVSANFPATACPVNYGAAADLNGDGKPDLVIPYPGDASCGSSDGGSSGYYVSLGNGDGTFAAPVFTVGGTQLYKLALGDINGDGKQDLLLVDDPFVNGTGFQVSYATGNGDGTFNTPNVFLQNQMVYDISIADINNDGKADLVLTSAEIQGTDATTAGILTITGNGDGTFNPPSEIAIGNYFFGIQVADMNNDGDADIVATLYQASSSPTSYDGMVTLLGYGNGQFAAPYNSFEDTQSSLPIVGNFVNDNALDVVTSNLYATALFIGQGGGTLALTTSASSINFGTAEVLTATLTSSLADRPAATGTVSFYDGTTLLGTAALSSAAATVTLSSLAVGTHKVDAVYSGDTNFNPATSASSTITVGALAPAFSLSGTPTTLSVTAGSTGVATLNLAANATFSGAVTLTCSGMPTNGSCSINPGSVTVAAGGSSTATLVVTTSGTVAQFKPSTTPWEAPGTAASLATLVCAFLGRRKRMSMLTALGIGLMLSFGTMLTGCSGKGSSVHTAKPGTYIVTVTATSASGSAASVQTTQVSVTVN